MANRKCECTTSIRPTPATWNYWDEMVVKPDTSRLQGDSKVFGKGYWPNTYYDKYPSPDNFMATAEIVGDLLDAQSLWFDFPLAPKQFMFQSAPWKQQYTFQVTGSGNSRRATPLAAMSGSPYDTGPEGATPSGTGR